MSCLKRLQFRQLRDILTAEMHYHTPARKDRTFPADWIVEGTKAQQYKQIGNAVPAVFGEAIGGVIVSHLKNFPTSKPVRIGVPASFKDYMEYTKKDHARNKASRTVHHRFNAASE